MRHGGTSNAPPRGAQPGRPAPSFQRSPQVHLILKHKNTKTGAIEEKHLKSPPSVPSDALSHVYTAILYPANNS